MPRITDCQSKRCMFLGRFGFFVSAPTATSTRKNKREIVHAGNLERAMAKRDERIDGWKVNFGTGFMDNLNIVSARNIDGEEAACRTLVTESNLYTQSAGNPVGNRNDSMAQVFEPGEGKIVDTKYTHLPDLIPCASSKLKDYANFGIDVFEASKLMRTI
jgi:hypothetical protein